MFLLSWTLICWLDKSGQKGDERKAKIVLLLIQDGRLIKLKLSAGIKATCK